MTLLTYLKTPPWSLWRSPHSLGCGGAYIPLSRHYNGASIITPSALKVDKPPQYLPQVGAMHTETMHLISSADFCWPHIQTGSRNNPQTVSTNLPMKTDIDAISMVIPILFCGGGGNFIDGLGLSVRLSGGRLCCCSTLSGCRSTTFVRYAF